MAILKRLCKLHKSQSGIGLVETLAAVAILGTAVAAFVGALSTGSLSVSEHEQEVIAQRLAQNQLEYTKNLAFSPSGAYATIASPSGYTINMAVNAVDGADANLQKITVTVLRNGSSLFEVSGYKVNR